MGYYSERIVNDPPKQQKFNGEYAFSFTATADETEAGTVIVRGSMVGFSNRNVPVGEQGTAELAGTITLSKAAATAFVQGDPVAWDGSAKLCIVPDTGAIMIGVCKITPSADSETVEVIMGYTPRPTL
jgi:predicted RecA/RadA family phage recombinase